MADMLNVLVGPCAEWLVPRERVATFVWDNPILEELGCGPGESSRTLDYVAPGGEFPVETRDGREYVRLTFFPGERRRDGFPAREIYYGCFALQAVSVDLSDVDQRAEVRWFAAAYKAELKRLTAHFGSKPQLSWSMHAWM